MSDELNASDGGMRGNSVRAWAVALALLAASFIAFSWLELRPTDDQKVAAIFPPWWNSDESDAAVAAADGAILGWGGLGSIVVTRSDRPGFAGRLHAAGALLLVEPSPLIGCSGPFRTKSEITKKLGGATGA